MSQDHQSWERRCLSAFRCLACYLWESPWWHSCLLCRFPRVYTGSESKTIPKEVLTHLQGSAKRCFLGCVNSLPGSASSLANSHAFLPISVDNDWIDMTKITDLLSHIPVSRCPPGVLSAWPRRRASGRPGRRPGWPPPPTRATAAVSCRPENVEHILLNTE